MDIAGCRRFEAWDYHATHTKVIDVVDGSLNNGDDVSIPSCHLVDQPC